MSWWLELKRIVSLRVNEERKTEQNLTHSELERPLWKEKEKNDDDISVFPSYEAGSHKNQAKSRAVLILHLIGQDLNSFVVIGLNGSALACSQKYTYQNETWKHDLYRVPKKRKGTHDVISFKSSIVSVLSFASTSSTSLKTIKE